MVIEISIKFQNPHFDAHYNLDDTVGGGSLMIRVEVKYSEMCAHVEKTPLEGRVESVSNGIKYKFYRTANPNGSKNSHFSFCISDECCAPSYTKETRSSYSCTTPYPDYSQGGAVTIYSSLMVKFAVLHQGRQRNRNGE